MVTVAGFYHFLRVIFWTCIIIYLFRFLVRFVVPWLLKRTIEKVQRQHDTSQRTSNVKKGETVVDKKPTRENNHRDDVGEYVDYEELD